MKEIQKKTDVLIRSFGEEHLGMKAADVAKELKIPVSQVYDIRREFKRRIRKEEKR